MDLESLGFIPYDQNILKAVKKQEPVMLSFPETEAVKSLERVVLRLLDIETREEAGGLKVFLKRLANFFPRR